MTKEKIKIFIWLLIFSIAMAYMESSVVVYLRKIYYPNGFSFPLNTIETNIALVEIFREAATIIMLVGIGILVGKSRIERFSFFIYSFAIWDIFYYVFLKIILSWPESLLSWDILFLIPITWTGPVITPIINSLTMILIAVILVYFKERNGKILVFRNFLYLLIIGSIFVLAAYLEEYMQYMMLKFSFFEMFSLTNNSILEYASTFVPNSFSWFLFSIGFLIHLGAIIYFSIRNLRN